MNPPPTTAPHPTLEVDAQLAVLETCGRISAESYLQAMHEGKTRYRRENETFCLGDALLLYRMLQLHKPKRIIEIGCGMSSGVILDANERVLNDRMHCTFIDQSAHAFERACRAEDFRTHVFIAKPVQEVELSVFQELEDGDVLFVDSSHVYEEGSDVHHILHHILPLLAPGVHIHFHDIFADWDYPIAWRQKEKRRRWNEAAALRHLLSSSNEYGIRLFSSYMRAHHADAFRATIYDSSSGNEGSLWMEKTTSSSFTVDSPRHIPYNNNERMRTSTHSPFAILFIERSGSTHLVSLLQSHPEVSCRHEIFPLPSHSTPAPQSIPERAELLKEAWSVPEGSVIKATGFKMQITQADCYPDVMQALRDRKSDLNLIVLRRTNVLHQALSTAHRNYWLRQKQITPPLVYMPVEKKVPVDIAHMHRMMAHYEQKNAALLEMTDEFPARLLITYEELRGQSEKTHRAILHFLGVSTEWTLLSTLHKVAPPDPGQWMANADELRASLEGTAWKDLW